MVQATKLAPIERVQLPNLRLELSGYKFNPSDIQNGMLRSSRVASGFDVIKNQDPKTRAGIEKAMPVWVVFPWGTGADAGWNSVHLDPDIFTQIWPDFRDKGTYEQANISDDAVRGIREGLPVLMFTIGLGMDGYADLLHLSMPSRTALTLLHHVVLISSEPSVPPELSIVKRRDPE